MEWSLDTFGAQTTKIWLFEATGALGTAVAAKAPKDLSGLLKQKCLRSSIEPQHRGATDDPREYYRGGWSSSPLPSVPM